MKIVSVKFKESGKSYYFNSNDYDLSPKDYVLVETEKGVQFGIIDEVGINNKKVKDESLLCDVIKIANKKDYNTYLRNLKDADLVLNDVRKRIKIENLQMRVIDANYTFDKKQLTINFLADERVDFRELVKYLASKYKTHIELHQVGVRDKAKEIGGIGQCGMPLCCKRFKKNMDGISINMAKNQSISLSPSKINGCCGRLLCCLSYEDDTYKNIKKQLPKINDVIEVDGQKGKVIKINILKKIVTVDIDGIQKEVDYNDK